MRAVDFQKQPRIAGLSPLETYLGKAGVGVVATHFVENETYERGCPRCRKDPLSKARHGVGKPAATVRGNLDADAAAVQKENKQKRAADLPGTTPVSSH